jgi:hypothetical protein
MPFYALVVPVVAILVIVAGATGAFLMRRHQLRATLGTFECDVQRGESKRWRSTICRYNADSLEFLKLWSLSPFPVLVLARTSLEITARRDPEKGELPLAEDDGIVVDLASDAGPIRIGLNYAAYTGLSAWIEAGPVAGVGTWRQ